MRQYIAVVIRILLGGTFCLSAYLKLFPIESFELNFIDLGIADWISAPFIARLLIGLEFFFGVALMLGLALKKFTLPAVLILLLIFSGYIIYQWITAGNKADCGCFGTYLQMTPAQSITKNILLASLAILLNILTQAKKIKREKIWLSMLAVGCLALPFLLNPIDLMAGQLRQPEAINFPLNINLILNESTKHDSVDLMSGKHIIAFVSLTCPHCKLAAFKMHVMEKRHPEIPFYFIMNGKESMLPQFYEATKADNIQHMFLFGKNFYTLTGGQLPQIYWVDHGIVVRKSLYISLQEDEILKWLSAN